MLLIIFKKYVIIKLAGVKQTPTFWEFLFSDLEIMKETKSSSKCDSKVKVIKNYHLPNVWPHFEHYL
jgi:hypothetical protein